MEYKNKKVTIMGLGLYPKGSGISAVQFLHAKGAKLVVTDLRTKEQLEPQLKKLKSLKGIEFVLGSHRMSDFKKADLIVKNPGVPMTSPYIKEAQKNKIPIHSDITLFMQEVDNPIIGITGTRGKSTTASLVYEMIKKQFPKSILGGNISVSPLQNIKKLDSDSPVVLELSSWMLNSMKTIKRSPNMSVVTNMMVDHLNMYPSYKAYVKDKELIYRYQKVTDVAIFNKDNAETKRMSQEAKSDVYVYSLKPLKGKEKGVYVNASREIIFIEGGKKEKIAKVSDIALKGDHNISNALAAILVAHLSGVSRVTIIAALKSFKGVDSRLETIRKVNGIEYINDTTATTPDACIAAINSFAKPPILIAGGTDKKLEFDEVAKVINSKIKKLVLLPGSATDILLQKLNLNKVEVVVVDSMKRAVQEASQFAVKGDVVVLSPGAASFGLFTNEFDRGAQFVKEVKKLK